MKATSHKLVDLADLLFMDSKSAAEKEKILVDEYDISLTCDMGKELTEMSGLMGPVLKIASIQAIEKARLKPKKIQTRRYAYPNEQNEMDSTRSNGRS